MIHIIDFSEIFFRGGGGGDTLCSGIYTFSYGLLLLTVDSFESAVIGLLQFGKYILSSSTVVPHFVHFFICYLHLLLVQK